MGYSNNFLKKAEKAERDVKKLARTRASLECYTAQQEAEKDAIQRGLQNIFENSCYHELYEQLTINVATPELRKLLRKHMRISRLKVELYHMELRTSEIYEIIEARGIFRLRLKLKKI